MPRCPSATAAVPPLSREPIDQLLVRHGNDTTTETAGRLFGLWGATYDPTAAGLRPYLAAGAQCLFQKGSWAQLRTLNRPAILTLTDDSVAHRPC
jgi:hypothetical protein